ncbi:MAG: PASTA domain-containing protein [Clostridiales bacterium]|nr:PASTA domain-containing protein [Clostridiales bacterium]
MFRSPVWEKRRLFFGFCVYEILLVLLLGRVFYIQFFQGEHLQSLAYEQQTRDRLIKAKRGIITDRNGTPLAENETAYSISVVHSQITDYEGTAKALSEALDLDYDEVLKKVNKRVALERIVTKADPEAAEKIRGLELKGVAVDEDVKRVYPYNSLASRVIGFVGKDNQGIIGLEAKYDAYLKGEQGKILTETDARGVELNFSKKTRNAPDDGKTLVTTIDINIQKYAEELISNAVEAKGAKKGAVIVMNPQNGEIYAMASKPDFDLNEPFTINDESLLSQWSSLSSEERNNYLNAMWRNFNINDTYEPGSTFKIVTSSAGLEEGVVKPDDTFNCGGGREVGGRYIKCWRSPRSHGTETFVEGVQNSCNPVFMDVAARLGSDKFYEYMLKFGFDKKTGIDLPGEAVGIMHKKENIGPVELATMSFGQTFQITPLQLLRAASSVINGGRLITPHVGKEVLNTDGSLFQALDFSSEERSISKETSDTMREILESVVYSGTGNKAYIPGYRIGGKTATSEKLPRGSGKYIASFMAFAPAENPQVIALVLIDEPQGVYYGGQVTGPVMKDLLSMVLPYVGIKAEYNEEELSNADIAPYTLEDYKGLKASEVKAELQKVGMEAVVVGDGDTITGQFPQAGEKIYKSSKIILYV